MVRDAENSAVYLFDGFRLDAKKRLVYDPEGNAVPLKAKAFETLLYLVENSGRVVERDELLSAIWPNTVVEENNLTQHISTLRRVFGEKPDEHRFIATIAGRGYQFVARVDRGNVPSEHAGRSTRGRWYLVLTAAVFSSLLLLGYYTYHHQLAKGDGPGSHQFPDDKAIKSIAVLPFQPLSEQDRNESIQMGMTQALIDNLAGAETLEVRPMSAVRRYDSLNQDVLQAGRDLGVDAVVDATIQQANERVSVSARLTRVDNGSQIWSGSFNQLLTEDIFAVQASIAERVASELKIRIDAKKQPTDNVEAYKLYLQGRTYYSRLAPEDVKQAIQYFGMAIKLDPNYALAYTGMSDSSRSLVLSGEERPSPAGYDAISAAERALRIDPELAEAHTVRGSAYFWFQHDFPKAEESFQKALTFGSKSPLAHISYAQLLSNIGRHDEAKEQAEEARRLDPYSAYSLTIQGLVYQQAGMLDEALRRFNQATDIDKRVWLAHMFAAVAHIDRKEYEEALASIQNASRVNPAQSMSMAYESVALARLKRHAEAKNALHALLERLKDKYVPPYHIAIAYMGLDDRDNALGWLEKSYREGDTKIVFLKVDRIWDPLRDDPRFIALMEKMNFPQ